jgi:hypothetical protein
MTTINRMEQASLDLAKAAEIVVERGLAREVHIDPLSGRVCTVGAVRIAINERTLWSHEGPAEICAADWARLNTAVDLLATYLVDAGEIPATLPDGSGKEVPATDMLDVFDVYTWSDYDCPDATTAARALMAASRYPTMEVE